MLLWTLAWHGVAPLAASAGDYGEVELIRDRWGTPHVFADSDAGAMYGLGYATAEDRGFQMHYSLRIMQGRLAELVGDVKKIRRNESAVTNDRKMRAFGFCRTAREVAGNLDAETLSLLEAYCDGVNDGLQEDLARRNELFDKLGLVPEPWTPADCLLSWWHVGQFFATDGTRDLLRHRNLTEGPPPGRRLPPGRGSRGVRRDSRSDAADLTPLGPDDRAAVVQRKDVTDAWIGRARAFLENHGFDPDEGTGARIQGSGLRVQDFAANRLLNPEPRTLTPPGLLVQTDARPRFSHAWVADGRATGTGSAVLVSKPQTPVTNPSLFYEFHIQGRTFNARGIGVPGSPAILIGFNRHVAWGLTALGADQADLFRLVTDTEHPDQYLFDGRWRPMDVVRETIRVRGARPQEIVIRQTHFGPIVNEFAFARSDDPPVALKRIPLCETDRETIQGALAMIRARDVESFRDALDGWRFPSANVVFGDSAGRIGYSTIGALVLRSHHALESGSAAHDGSESRFDWQAVVPQELVPQVVDPKQGYLFSGNHRPIASFYPIPLGIRTGSGGDTLRSWRLRELLGSGEPLTPDRLLEMKNDSVHPARRDIVRVGLHLRDVLDRDLSPDALAALAELEPWYAAGARSRLDVDGGPLAMELNTFFRMLATDLALIYGGGESGLSYFLKTVKRRLNEDPKARIEPLEEEFIDHALANAWRSATAKFGPDSSLWVKHARQQARQRKLGYYESLDGFPSLDSAQDLAVPELSCIDGGTIHSAAAEAYTQWVPLDDPDRARSLLPPGPSEQPDSPWHTVNCRAWAAGELHPAPLSRESVEEIGESIVVLKP